MGKGQSSTPSELKFIYEMLAEGYSDTDILAKYKDLEKHGKLGSLPSRQDVRFIRQKRKEYEAAEKVLQAKLKLYADPALAQARDEHLAQLHKYIEEWITHILMPPDINQFPFDELKGYFCIDDAMWLQDAFFNEDISRPIDECLKQHLPYTDLWGNTKSILETFGDYYDKCKLLIQQFKDECATWPVKFGKDFERPLLFYLGYTKWRENTSSFQWQSITWEVESETLLACLGSNIRWIVLEGENPAIYEEQYSEVIKRFLETEAFNSAKDRYRKLSHLFLSVSHSLDEICAQGKVDSFSQKDYRVQHILPAALIVVSDHTIDKYNVYTL